MSHLSLRQPVDTAPTVSTPYAGHRASQSQRHVEATASRSDKSASARPVEAGSQPAPDQSKRKVSRGRQPASAVRFHLAGPTANSAGSGIKRPPQRDPPRNSGPMMGGVTLGRLVCWRLPRGLEEPGALSSDRKGRSEHRRSQLFRITLPFRCAAPSAASRAPQSSSVAEGQVTVLEGRAEDGNRLRTPNKSV